MRNTMDSILVEYGGLDNAQICSLPEFLASKNLSSDERKTQEALSVLYRLNQTHHLFDTDFPINNGNPLLIRAGIAVGEGDPRETQAHYVPLTHTVSVLREGIPPLELAVVLAHELEHAKQMTPEMIALMADPNTNALQKQQIGYLKEAQAFAFDKRVKALLESDKDYNDSRTLLSVFDTEITEKKIEQDLMLHILPVLFKGKYKDSYDKDYPILDTDKGLEVFPSVLNINDDIKEMIAKVPRAARMPQNRIRQAFANQKEKQIAPELQRLSQEDIFLFCKELADSNREADLKLLVAVLSSKDNNGSYIVSPQTIRDMLIVQARNHNLKPMEPLFQDRDATGQRRVSTNDFTQLVTAVRLKGDMLISIFSQMNPRQYSADLALINRFETLYYAPQRAQTPLFRMRAGVEYA